jgi:hypothetical protein
MVPAAAVVEWPKPQRDRAFSSLFHYIKPYCSHAIGSLLFFAS